MIERHKITTSLIAAIETEGKPVGFAQAPTDGGWRGQPNVDGTNFVPYVVVTANPASAPRGIYEGPMSDWQADWQLPYTVSSFGAVPDQTEWMADRARLAAHALVNTDLQSGSAVYRVLQVRVDALGGLVRVDATEPPYWGQNDQITVWLSKE